jgi:hypothetical protein
VFDEWGYGDPDFVEGHIMIFTGRVIRCDHILPATAEIYVWNGSAMVRVESVPYQNRFEALSKLVRAPKGIASPGCRE